jgi:hypothetical protein
MGYVKGESERMWAGKEDLKKGFFFPCCTSRGRRRIMSFKATLFCVASSFFLRKRNEFGE